MNQETNQYVASLSGYLLCLSRLCGSEYAFSAACYSAEEEVESFIQRIVCKWNENNKNVLFSYHGSEIIQYSELMKEISSYILKVTSEYSKKMLIEDISEYYGLVSTSINEKGVFHPLIGSPVYKANIQSGSLKRVLLYVVQVENLFISTVFYEKHAGI